MFPWQPFFFRSLPFLGVKVPQQLYSADNSTLLQGPPTIWTPTEGMRLLASRGPQGGTPAPTLSRRFRSSGSQRVPLLAVMNASGGADAGHKRRLENRLMVRRRDP